MTNNSEALTRDAWIERCLYWFDGHSAEFWGKIFDDFEGNPQMMVFLSYSDTLQVSILSKLSRGVSARNVISYLDLCHRIEAKLQMMCGNQKRYYCDEMPFRDLESLLDCVIGSPSEGYLQLENLVFSIIRKDGNVYRKTWSPHPRETMYSLRALHGEEIIVEIMKRWVESNEFIDMYEMILLADNWSIVEKYPIHWGIKILV